MALGLAAAVTAGGCRADLVGPSRARLVAGTYARAVDHGQALPYTIPYWTPWSGDTVLVHTDGALTLGADGTVAATDAYRVPVPGGGPGGVQRMQAAGRWELSGDSAVVLHFASPGVGDSAVVLATAGRDTLRSAAAVYAR